MKARLFLALIATLLLIISPARAEITIAAVGPITGQDATTGEQMQHGVEAAVEAINAAGGVNGQKLRLVIKDDACDPKQTVSIANQLAADGISIMIGPMCSGSAIAAAKITSEENILMISPSATSPLLTDAGIDTIFRVCWRDDQQGKVLADTILSHEKGKAVAVIHDKTAFGQGLAEVVSRLLDNGGMKPKLYESITRGERDFSPLIAKLKQNDIGAIFYGGYYTEAGLLVRQMRDQGLPAHFYSDDDLITREFWKITGEAGEGAMMSFTPDPRTRPQAAEAVKIFKEKNFDPEGLTMYSYAAVQVAAEAMRRAGSSDSKKLSTVLHQGTYPTVLGDLAFDKKGDIINPEFVLYRWHNGVYEPLGTK